MTNLKTFKAKTMADALAQVKREFGKDAVIYHTKTATEGGVMGIGSHQYVEISAANGEFSLPGDSPTTTVATRSGKSPRADAARRTMNRADRDNSNATRDGRDTPVSLSNDIASLKNAVAELVRESRQREDPTLPDRLQDAYRTLIQAQVARDVAGQLVRRLRSELSDHQLTDAEAVRAKLASYVESMLPTAPSTKLAAVCGPVVIALVGPTGVGKTTTIAKLAANYRLRENRKVGLITIDTHRIGAADQLRTYADIINVPLEVAAVPDDTRAAITRMSDCDVVLIDSAGTCGSDDSFMNELRAHLEEAKPHEVHLVLSSTMSPPVLAHQIERFRPAGVNRVIFSKLDEAVGFGMMLGALECADVRLSYVTTGQTVPDDIERGGDAPLADLILCDRQQERQLQPSTGGA
jgi:flagellar biosynthesis protein FlhF